MQYKEGIMNSIKMLTEVQREAASWDDGPLLVLAGPGSGKTRVLTLRIARLLMESEEDNFRVLGLTFTNKAADEMRTRIREIVPGMDKRLYLGTFHSFCAEVLRNHGSHVKVKPDFTIYSENQDLDEIISEVNNDLLNRGEIRPLNVSKILPIIQYLKAKLVSPNTDLSTYINSVDDRSSIEKIYSHYEQRLKDLNALDFNSLIMKANELFVNHSFIAKHYRTIYPYICIDEFQDTNQGQYNLIRSLAKEKHNNLFIVADDDQVIYQWNGASASRVEEFRMEYEAQVVQLPENFRCPPEVVQLANNLILFNVNRSKDKKPLEAKKPIQESFEVNLECFQNYPIEAQWVAETVQGNIDSKNKKSIAVIARNRKLLLPIHDILKSMSVPVVMGQRKNEFESVQVSLVHYILRLANKRNDKKFLNRLVLNFNSLTDNFINTEEIIAWSRATDGDYLRGFLNIIQPKLVFDKNLLKSLEYDLVEGKDFFRFVETSFDWLNVFSSSNEEFEDDLYNDEKKVWDELVKLLLSRYDKEEITLGMFLQEFDLLSKEAEPDEQSVQCLTIHASKGKEFDHIYLVGMVEDELPSFQSKKKGDHSIEMEEERRNCFVAITRAKETLTMSYSNKYNGWIKKPSRFLYEMGVLETNTNSLE
jgi:DNA helicase-2/ATP-dependent DNA helicase PcrA